MKIILYYFETYFENFYFKKIEEEEEKDKKAKYEKILLNKDKYESLDIIKNYLNYLDNNQDINFRAVYRIAFIKIYFKYFVDFMYERNNDNALINFEEIIKTNLLLKTRKFNFLKEIKELLKIKCNEKNINLESFISDNGINYLDFNENEISQKIPLMSLLHCYPNKELIKATFNSKDINKKKYPLLNQYLNNENEIKFIKFIPIINFISNAMLDIYSYKKTKEEIKDISLSKDEIKDKSQELYNNFDNKMPEYIKCYNSLLNILELDKKEKYELKSDYIGKSIELFLVNENDNEINKNQLKNILTILIKYQNNFISNIREKYFVNKEIEEINIQDASENDIIKFSPFDDQFLQILLKNILLTNNSENESLIKIDIDYEGIESELEEKILFGLKKFTKK